MQCFYSNIENMGRSSQDTIFMMTTTKTVLRGIPDEESYTSAGGLVTESTVGPIVNCSVLKWSLSYTFVYLLMKFTVPK